MSRLARIILGLAAAVVVAASAAAYLTGFIIIGDPFSGVWNVDGEWRDKGVNSGDLIKQTDDGYFFAAIGGVGKTVKATGGWHPLRRDGRTLVGEWDIEWDSDRVTSERVTFEYQPWTGRLVSRWWEDGVQQGNGMPLKKATTTSVSLQTN